MTEETRAEFERLREWCEGHADRSHAGSFRRPDSLDEFEWGVEMGLTQVAKEITRRLARDDADTRAAKEDAAVIGARVVAEAKDGLVE